MSNIKHNIKKLLKWLIPVAIIFVAIIISMVSTITKLKKAGSTESSLAISTTKASYGSISNILKLNAYVESENMVTVLPLVAGILEDLYVDVGQDVKKDQALGQVEAARYQLQFQQAEAAYLAAKSTFERVSQLYKANASSQQNYEQAKGQYDAYASQYELAKLQLDYTKIKCPIDGVILMKHLSVGSLAAPERPLVTIGDLSKLVVKVKVPERYYELFTQNQDSMKIVISRSNGDSYNGKIKSVSPFVSAETKNFEVSVAIDDEKKSLRPGMFVNTEFELAHWDEVFYLPYNIMTAGNTLWIVEDGKAKAVTFKPTISTSEFFVIPKEWNEKEFISEGQYFASDGIKVSITNQTEGKN